MVEENCCWEDIVFIKEKIAIECDGCYWHGCTICKFKDGIIDDPKILRHIECDKIKDKLLNEDGWKLLRFWGHEIKEDADKCAQKIIDELTITKK